MTAAWNPRAAMGAVSRAPTEQDVDAMLETLVVAFARDPVWGGWAFPDRDRATAQRRAFFDLWLRSALRYPAVRVTDRCEAVALWYPPGGSEETEEDQRRLVATARSLLSDNADAFLKACDVIEAAHPKRKPHYYLSLLGTHDEHRGKGLGMALLRENLARIDKTGLPVYLESTNPANNARYERIGFTCIGAYRLPGDGPRIEMMWRAAATARGAPRPEGTPGQSDPGGPMESCG